MSRGTRDSQGPRVSKRRAQDLSSEALRRCLPLLLRARVRVRGLGLGPGQSRVGRVYRILGACVLKAGRGRCSLSCSAASSRPAARALTSSATTALAHALACASLTSRRRLRWGVCGGMRGLVELDMAR